MLMFCPNIGDEISSMEHILTLANTPMFGGLSRHCLISQC
jgi:hypothetical protein